MWDYDKLFAEGNVVGIKFMNEEFTIDIIKGRNRAEWQRMYANNVLGRNNSFVQYIIRLDEHGNMVEKLFDRERDMKEPMPELKTGMFVKVQHYLHSVGVIVGDRVIYEGEGWDRLEEMTEDIIKVWPETTCGFSACYNDEPIWERF